MDVPAEERMEAGRQLLEGGADLILIERRLDERASLVGDPVLEVESAPQHGCGVSRAMPRGGGGAALGGAIFAHSGALTVDACTFTNNVASGGASGRNHFGGPAAAIGGSYGPAIFTYGAVHELDEDISYEGNISETDASNWYHFE